MNGLGSDPNQMIDIDSIKREKRKLFTNEFDNNVLYISTHPFH